MNNIQVFNHEQFGEIRTVVDESSNEVWFVAADICKALDIANTTQAVARLEEFEKSMFNIGLSGGATNCISESGMYALVLRSRKPSAKQFRVWVTSEVLPSIRKHGAYVINRVDSYQIDDPIERAKAWIKEEEERQALQETIQIQAPKVKFHDDVLDTESSMTATQVAKTLGLRSAIQLNNLLHELGIQYNQSGQWLLYSKYADKGYTATSTHLYNDSTGTKRTSKATKWTEKGVKFIYESLKKHDLI